MGFLGFGNYNRPGPGVEKDEPPKSAPARYFEILSRKFTKLIQVNLLFFIPFLVCLILAFLIFLIPVPNRGVTFFTDTGSVSVNLWVMYVCPLPFILLSPFISGMTMITRNFVREEHAFIWHDFIKATKENAKYSIINGLISYLLYVVLSFSIIYYFNRLNDNWFFYVPLAVCLVFAIIFIFAQYYVPTMIITFDLKLKQIYKNAFILAALGIGRNILMSLLFVGLIVAFVFIPQPYFILLLIALSLLILFAFISYTTSFVTYPVIKKYLIDPYNKQQEETKNPGLKEEGEKDKFDAMFDHVEEDDDDPEGYVYVNGRLIKKSDLKDD